jgi:hypothetical protein
MSDLTAAIGRPNRPKLPTVLDGRYPRTAKRSCVRSVSLAAGRVEAAGRRCRTMSRGERSRARSSTGGDQSWGDGGGGATTGVCQPHPKTQPFLHSFHESRGCKDASSTPTRRRHPRAHPQMALNVAVTTCAHDHTRAARYRLAKPPARRPCHRVRAPSSASQHDTTRCMARGGGGVGLSLVQLTPADLAAAYAKAPWLAPCRGCRGVPSTAGCTMQVSDFGIGRPPARPIRRVRGTLWKTGRRAIGLGVEAVAEMRHLFVALKVRRARPDGRIAARQFVSVNGRHAPGPAGSKSRSYTDPSARRVQWRGMHWSVGA